MKENGTQCSTKQRITMCSKFVAITTFDIVAGGITMIYVFHTIVSPAYAHRRR